MEKRLIVVLVVIMVLLLLYMFKVVKKDKISMNNILIWLVLDVLVIFCIIFVDPLFNVANFLGIETVANMMFFIGFICLIVICFNLSNKVSIQNKKIITLTQELGILKNRIDKLVK